MKRLNTLIGMCLIALLLTGCPAAPGETVAPGATATATLQPTQPPPTAITLPRPTSTPTRTPWPTYPTPNPDIALPFVEAMLADNGGCDLPC